MRIVLGILAGIIGPCVLSADIQGATTEEEWPVYRGLEPGAFMRQWLICDPFAVFDGPANADDSTAQRQAFDRDYLADQGGESRIRPIPGLLHQRGQGKYRWRRAEIPTDVIDLVRRYGNKEYMIVYAWARIDMPAETPALLGIGSDDAVKVWLNGEPVHENWTDRPAREDDDLVPVTFRAGRNELLLKVQNGREFWGFACRIADPKTLGNRLLTALNGGDLDAARTCLSYGAQVNATDKYGFTPLQVARMRGYEQIAQMLLDKHADPNAPLPAVGTPKGFLDLLWESLVENYPMMEYAGAFDESWYEACKRQIQDVNGLYEALPIMDAMLVRKLNDYHTQMHWDGKPRPVGPPVRVERIENRIVVTQCPQELGIARGDVVLEIDGADAGERFDLAWPEAFGATAYARARYACWAILEGRPGSQVKLKLSDRRGEVYEKSLTRGAGTLDSPREPALSSRIIDDRTGYIRISRWAGFSGGEFDELLEPLREKPVLILDVRDNGGGADRLAEIVIGRFITRDVVASISFQRHPGTNLYDKTVFIVLPRGPWCYRGKVVVLINEGCASACEHFVSGMLEAGALLVGTPTTGACGWSKEIELPAGVALRCALTFPLHGKVPSPLHGIEPHRLVTPTIEDIRAGRDTVLEKALTLPAPEIGR